MNPSDRELHLYLTDYRSLYVGHVDQITADDVTRTDAGHVPPYYRSESLACDCWFKLLDIRRLAQDNTLAVIGELKKLRNLHYEDRPVSLYGGMVDLPLVVSREDGTHFFDDDNRDALIGDQLWVEFDAEAGGAGAMQRELRENLFGEQAWAVLDPATQAFLATAEKVFRDHRNDESFDFQSVMTGYAKALELESNRLLRVLLEKAPEEVVWENLDGVSRNLRRYRLTLGRFPRVLGGDQKRARYLASATTRGGWLVSQYPAILEAFVQEVRNPGTHQQRVDRRAATRWRDRLAGVGCEGVLIELARCLG